MHQRPPPRSCRRLTRRTALLAGAGAAVLGIVPCRARAQTAPTVRIALPTKTWFPTTLTEAARRNKLFEKEGIAAEPTVYRGGAECIEALAAGAADISVSGPPLTGAAIRKGVAIKIVATAVRGYPGWYLLVRIDSPVKAVTELAGKKVGITSAGSGTDFLALWSAQNDKIEFTRVPLGGGGLVPNLRSGNVDAAVIYSPLSFELIRANQARVLVDYGTAVPAHLAGGWSVPDKLIETKPEIVQKTLNALYGGLKWLRENREPAIALIAEIDELKPEIATMEYERSILQLATDARVDKEEVQRALDLGKLIGITDTAPIEQIYSTRFTPVPTT